MEKHQQLWETEYERQGIPSSYRGTPTKAVAGFVSFLQGLGIYSGSGIDLGCGKGRNAFFLAESGYHVVGLDLVETNAQEINARAAEQNLPVKAYSQDIATPWPVKSEQLDFAIDIFCYKHIVDKEAQRNYRKHLKEALKMNGYYLLNLASDDDGFYGPLLSNSPDPAHKLVIDPYSQISSLLYTLEEIIHEFSDALHLVEAKKVSSVSPMYGKEYPRQVLSLIFQKKSIKTI
jgi:SAM-dependent methyltransferase